MAMEQYDINWKDYYAILGISRDAEPEVIKAAYTALAKKYHPDTNGSSDNTQRMKDINQAYECLSDQARRTEYHRVYLERQRFFEEETKAPPNTEEFTPTKEKILPWPSWRWQRIALFASFPMALGLLFLLRTEMAWVVGVLLLVASSYACVKTRCLGRTRQAKPVARFAGGLTISLSLCGLGLAAVGLAAGVAAVIAIAVLALLARRVLLSSRAESRPA